MRAQDVWKEEAKHEPLIEHLMGREGLGPDLGRVPRPGWQIFFCRDSQVIIAHPPPPGVEMSVV